MRSRKSPLALDTGASSDADETLPQTAKERVAAAITAILSECGTLTDDQIVSEYNARAAAYSSTPQVTAQRIRTARADLVRMGDVRDAGLLAYSRLGNRATAWTLA